MIHVRGELGAGEDVCDFGKMLPFFFVFCCFFSSKSGKKCQGGERVSVGGVVVCTIIILWEREEEGTATKSVFCVLLRGNL